MEIQVSMFLPSVRLKSSHQCFNPPLQPQSERLASRLAVLGGTHKVNRQYNFLGTSAAAVAFCGNSPKADGGDLLLLRGDALFLGLGHDLRNDLGAFLARKRFDATRRSLRT